MGESEAQVARPGDVVVRSARASSAGGPDARGAGMRSRARGAAAPAPLRGPCA